MNSFYHYTDKVAFQTIIKFTNEHGYLIPSGIFQLRTGDSAYGTGWYVTALPPNTPTADLLWHLWMSNPEMLSKTGYWLELAIPASSVIFPDANRPFVGLIQYFHQKPFVDGSAVSVVGSGPEVLLKAAGRRVESAGKVKVTTLHTFKNSIAIEAFQAGIFGVRSLHWSQRQAILDLYKIENSDDSFHIEVEKLIDEADAFYKQGEFTAALTKADEAIRLDPQASIAWNNKGAILAAIGQRQDALAAYKRAMEINPKYVDAMRNAAASLLHLHRHSEALDMCERALAIDPQNAAVWTNKGVIYAARKEFDEALNAFKIALEINPKVAQAWKNRGSILAERAIQKLKHLSTDSQGGSDLLRSAIESFVSALEHDATYEEARQSLQIITQFALEGLPWTWECEEAVWRAATIDNHCLEDLTAQLLKANFEIHPRLRMLMESKGYYQDDHKMMFDLFGEALVLVRRWEWTAEEVFGPNHERIQFGICLLVDLLSRTGLVKLALRLADIVMETGPNRVAVENGSLLQIAKAVAAAGLNLRKIECYEQAIEAYHKARAIYQRSGDQKYSAHMTFNIGAAYARRNQSDDQDRARSAFEASFEEYNRAGFSEDRKAAERDAQKLLGQRKGFMQGIIKAVSKR